MQDFLFLLILFYGEAPKVNFDHLFILLQIMRFLIEPINKLLFTQNVCMGCKGPLHTEPKPEKKKKKKTRNTNIKIKL